jgi:hypothetical protein
MNKKYIYTLCLLMMTAWGLTSCLKDNDEEVTLHDDMVITDFALTVVNQFVTVKSSSGADSTYKKTIISGLPIFNIDQNKGQIFNNTPLPANCDLKHILASVGSKNNGVITIKSMISDSLFYFSSTDSIDFSQPRLLRVYASDNSGFRDYTITVNMAETESGKMLWDEFPAGSEEIEQALYQQILLTPGDASKFNLSKDSGNTWTEELIGDNEDASLLPTSTLAWLVFPFKANANTDYEMLVGILDSESTTYTFWRKIVDKNAEAPTAKWVNMPIETDRQYLLPLMDSLSLIWYNENLYAIGNNGKIYKSIDQGISWRVCEDFTLPEDMESNNVKAVTDADGNLWILNADSGRVWKGVMSK